MVYARMQILAGQWGEAWENLVAMNEWYPRPYMSMEVRAQLALCPSLPTTTSRVEGIRKTFSQWEPQFEGDKYRRLFWLTLLDYRLGDRTSASEFSQNLKDQAVQFESEGNLSVAQEIRLMIEGLGAYEALLDGDLERALQEIEAATPEDLAYDGWNNGVFRFMRYLRAVVNQESNRYGVALRWYDTLNRGWGAEPFFTAPKHLHMGEIHDRLGNTGEAIRHYSRFVELWKDCDPEFRPLVQKARVRLDQLTDGSG